MELFIVLYGGQRGTIGCIKSVSLKTFFMCSHQRSISIVIFEVVTFCSPYKKKMQEHAGDNYGGNASAHEACKIHLLGAFIFFPITQVWCKYHQAPDYKRQIAHTSQICRRQLRIRGVNNLWSEKFHKCIDNSKDPENEHVVLKTGNRRALIPSCKRKNSNTTPPAIKS